MTLARVIKTQGRRGEVAVEPHSAVPGRLRPGMRLYALGREGSRQALAVEDLWPHKGHLILRFRGVDSISQADALRGAELQVPVEERAVLAPGWTYVSDLVGSTVFDGDREVGRIEEVVFGAGEAPLLMVRREQRELAIPYAAAYVTRLDLQARRLEMRLPAGMLELDAPLSPEEKQRQRGRR